MPLGIHKTTFRRWKGDPTELPGSPSDWVLYGKSQANTLEDYQTAVAIPVKYTKLSARGDAIVEMSQGEKDAVDAAEAAAEAERQQANADLADVRDQFAAIRDDIQQVIDGTASNINQVNAALNRLARVQLRMLKGLYRIVQRGGV